MSSKYAEFSLRQLVPSVKEEKLEEEDAVMLLKPNSPTVAPVSTSALCAPLLAGLVCLVIGMASAVFIVIIGTLVRSRSSPSPLPTIPPLLLPSASTPPIPSGSHGPINQNLAESEVTTQAGKMGEPSDLGLDDHPPAGNGHNHDAAKATYKFLIVVSNGRSGSTVLVNTLLKFGIDTNHTYIGLTRSFGKNLRTARGFEFFGSNTLDLKSVHNPTMSIKTAVREGTVIRGGLHGATLVYKHKPYYHSESYRKLFEWHAKYTSTKVILSRRSYLERYISHLEHTMLPHLPAHCKKNKNKTGKAACAKKLTLTVRIDIDDLIERYNRYNKEIRWYQNLFQELGIPVFETYYEKFLTSNSTASRIAWCAIARFLGEACSTELMAVRPQPLFSSPSDAEYRMPLQEKIENWEELYSALQKKHLEHLLY